MLNMIHPLMVELVDMIIVKGVVDMLAFFACAYNAQGAQNAQLVGNGGLAHFKGDAEIANTHFRVRQDADDADACGVCQRLE